MTPSTAASTDGRRGGPATPAERAGVRPGAWAGYGACVWSLLFAALSFYWAAGGLVGAGTIGPAVEGPALAREPAFVAVLWATALLKVVAALLALALLRQLPRWAPRWLLLLAGWGAAGLLSLYALANLAQHLLIVAGVVEVPAGLGRAALPWHLLLWDPIWLAGGLLFTLTAIRYARLTSRTAQHKLMN
ncbi:Protein of unknown function (DUF3995) [Micromonospora viridifaciens]|uniref:DUF3995 domain-containing protein n=1 Tax=Micromonospora viridifaciens TaxID=1881 RepID=A0A1C4X520_MICVI|nr:DUF3995 domain-containing protein [Micromonospora viridifaciens]SCF03555.1 Protein of unknown function (DUF3995) [Micromonospora viridifaciens]